MMLLVPWSAFVAALRDSETARDFDERFDEALDSLMRLCTGFVVTQIFRANLSSDLNASQGVIWKIYKKCDVENSKVLF